MKAKKETKSPLMTPISSDPCHSREDNFKQPQESSLQDVSSATTTTTTTTTTILLAKQLDHQQMLLKRTHQNVVTT
jgi:hypothetical protein